MVLILILLLTLIFEKVILPISDQRAAAATAYTTSLEASQCMLARSILVDCACRDDADDGDLSVSSDNNNSQACYVMLQIAYLLPPSSPPTHSHVARSLLCITFTVQ